MPGIYTHSVFGQRVLEATEDQGVSDFLRKYYREFYIGVQGPGYLKMYNILPWEKPDDDIKDVIKFFRERNVGRAISMMLKYVLEAPVEEQEPLLAYMCGYVTHYMLECAVNPYILYRAGFCLPNQTPTNKYDVYFERLTNDIEYLLVQEKTNKKPGEISEKEFLDISVDSLNYIARMYGQIIKVLYLKEVSVDQIKESYITLYELAPFFAKPGGIKRLLINLYGILSYNKANNLKIHYVDGSGNKAGLDVLNNGHKEWVWPWDKRVTRTNSVGQMFDDTIPKAVSVIKYVYDYKFNNLPAIVVTDKVGENSMVTGMPWGIPMIYKYYSLIYEKDKISDADAIL